MSDTRKYQDQIAKLLSEAEDKINEAVKIADAHKLSFSWDGPAYGMGGWYDGNEEERSSYSEDGWSSSSSSC